MIIGKKLIRNLSFIFVGTGVFLFACTKNGITRPLYKFKGNQNSDSTIAAKFGNHTILTSELVKGIEGEIFEAEYKVFEIKFNRLKALILEKLIQNHPKKKNLSNDDFLDQVIAKDVKPSDKDIQNFIEKRKIPKEALTPDFMERVRGFLVMELKRKSIEDWMNKETNKMNVEIYLAKPERPTFDVPLEDSPYSGDKNAKVTLVAYSDFQCPHCQNGSEIVNQLKKTYGKKIKVVFKHFPMPFHQDAHGAAEASLCANEQGMDKFWKMHDEFFKDQTKLSVDKIKETAKKIGLDAQKFSTCLDSKKYAAKVDEEMKKAESIGVKATPTFFINGKLINGARPIEEFTELIEDEFSNV